jgi:hypothetical protein
MSRSDSGWRAPVVAATTGTNATFGTNRAPKKAPIPDGGQRYDGRDGEATDRRVGVCPWRQEAHPRRWGRRFFPVRDPRSFSCRAARIPVPTTEQIADLPAALSAAVVGAIAAASGAMAAIYTTRKKDEVNSAPGAQATANQRCGGLAPWPSGSPPDQLSLSQVSHFAGKRRGE